KRRMVELVESLKRILESAREWERKPTTIPGIFLMKLPGYRKSPPRLIVEVNPTDSYGNPTKKRGLIIRGMADLEEYRKILANKKIEELLEALAKVNPPLVERGKTGGEVVEI
ncbi:MAG: hypothetical protein ACK4GQ_00685, partial [Candidatus Hadarchaeales archaeon]